MRTFGKFLSSVVPLDPVMRVRHLYQLIPESLEFAGRSTRYMNYGYWDDGCTSMDAASEALARLLADAAGITAGDVVLDVGFGHGDQDFLWLQERQPARVHGVNITPHHVESARRRAADEGVADRLEFHLGSATDLPFPDATFDRVVALECAFHFRTRRTFLAEALRVLRPGGTIGLIDILPVDQETPQTALRSIQFDWISRTYDPANWYGTGRYLGELAGVGFTAGAIRSIRERVYEPYRRAMVEQLADPDFVASLEPGQHETLIRVWEGQETLGSDLAMLDYVVVTATKPA
ncbi:cyclopropane-fatty-acyl-phospholipid synthase family protein [Actinoplanes sp. DH11]|uniref:SAM-dependent methyltransferase n=1 Tax=Actinoplanes sp. DH11 TaxID=2857011 RepID=UPI001E5A6CCC|nr:class I SAM-dependent methyltransferase [Actinoplanes sp. DH11]